MGRRHGLVLVLMSLALAGCAKLDGSAAADNVAVQTAGCWAITTAPAMTIDGTAQPENQNTLDDIAGRIKPYAQEHFADAYAGLEIRSPANRVRVYRVPSAAFDSWLTGTFANVCVEVVKARHTARELNALAKRIVDDFDHWRSVGVPIYSVSPQEDGSGVEVTTGDVAMARLQLQQRYGSSAPIIVTEGAPIQPASFVDSGPATVH